MDFFGSLAAARGKNADETPNPDDGGGWFGAPPVLPPWVGPPQAVLPTSVPLQSIVFRCEDVVVALTGVQVYPVGVLFEIEMVARRGTRSVEGVWTTPCQAPS